MRSKKKLCSEKDIAEFKRLRNNSLSMFSFFYSVYSREISFLFFQIKHSSNHLTNPAAVDQFTGGPKYLTWSPENRFFDIWFLMHFLLDCLAVHHNTLRYLGV